ncbi:MAG TPA: pyridoxal-dependent decarboxylase [Bryobacteraceae bacterium]|nr:pyridoxal-dependent decarboxylase [Bryobacteraceae bacterium]
MTATRDMPVDEFRRYGKTLVDWIADYLDDPRKYPVLAAGQPGDLRQRLPAAPPIEGEPMEKILRDFEQVILPGVTHWNHPRFFAYFSVTSSAPGILGELLTAALNVNAMLWKSCPAATELEQTTTQWVLEWLGLPASWFGMIVDSASNAVLQAIVAARQRAEPQSRAVGPSGRLVAYVSEQTHSSVEKAAIAAGIGQSNIRHIAVDAKFSMRTGALAEAIRSDLAGNRKPFFAAATIGTTSSTAIDPVPDIARICREHGLWLHVDGAYGGTLGILPECRHFLEGVEQADSFVVNPHKLMMAPLDCSLFYTRHPEMVRAAFALDAEYLKTEAHGAVDYMDYGLALGRRFRALKLWFVMRYFGREGLIAILRRRLEMAAWLGQRISADERFHLAAPVNMGLVCFQSREGDDASRDLMRRINDSCAFFVSHTVLEGRFTIRVAIGNMRTEWRDVEALWAAIST